MNQPLSFQSKDTMNENDRFCTDLQRGNLLQHSETCFDQNKINKDDLNQCKPTCLETKNDNYKDKINDTKQNEALLSSDKENISKSLSNGKQKNVPKSNHVHVLIDKINQLQLTKHHIIMIILNILMILTLLIVRQYLKRSSVNKRIDVEEILIMKRGNPYGGPGGEKLLDDAETATLTFGDAIIRVTASQSVDLSGEALLLSLTFTYSNGKIGAEYGGIGRVSRWEDLNPLELTPSEHINHLTIYEGYRNITNPWRAGKLTYIIVGISFETDNNQKILYGSTKGTRKEESFKNYFLAYTQGKAGGNIDSLRFTWYKYCLKNSSIVEKNN